VVYPGVHPFAYDMPVVILIFRVECSSGIGGVRGRCLMTSRMPVQNGATFLGGHDRQFYDAVFPHRCPRKSNLFYVRDFGLLLRVSNRAFKCSTIMNDLMLKQRFGFCR